ncbi:DUF4231 domain-containing protein [Intestinibacter bartlettii]|uniref:DUF4231 domain-containing protein n=1 Tax=Intestinibacter bartlettii TaxID=261299 RepID=UPI002AAF2379|nr:DUF4231 domain-containing protein [Intestinibacter bartlettii]
MKVKILNLIEIKRPNENIENRTDQPLNRNNYVKNRLDDQIKWYSNKSEIAQNHYKIIMTVTFILNATIPIILLFSDLINLPVKVLATSCTSIIAICTSILQLNSYQEIWLKYRITCENLLREKIFFETNTGKYKDTEDSLELLIITCEKIMDSETTEWMSYINSENQSSTSS